MDVIVDVSSNCESVGMMGAGGVMKVGCRMEGKI